METPKPPGKYTLVVGRNEPIGVEMTEINLTPHQPPVRLAGKTITIEGRVNVGYTSPNIWLYLRSACFPGRKHWPLRQTWFYRYKLRRHR